MSTERFIAFSVKVVVSMSRSLMKDDLEAVRWFRRAAEQGNEVAQGFLGRMYTSGEGVLRDLVLAHMWYNIAGANGHSMSKSPLKPQSAWRR